MAETYDIKTAIPKENILNIYKIFNRPKLTNPNMIVVGDPYINFDAKDSIGSLKEFYTRNFNHSELVPSKETYKDILSEKTQWKFNEGKSFTIPLLEQNEQPTVLGKGGTQIKVGELTGKIVGYIRGFVRTGNNGNNVFHVSNMEISHGGYGSTFAEGQKDTKLKTNTGRTILLQVLQKLPFIDEITGHRISGARGKAEDAEIQSRKGILNRLLRYRPVKTIQKTATVNPNVISKIKNNLANKGLIDGFFTQAKLSTEKVKEWLTKNNRAIAGVAMSGNDPMAHIGVKSMGSAIEDPSNYYLKMAEGGFVKGDEFPSEFSDMIEFVSSTKMNSGGMLFQPMYEKKSYNNIEKAIK